jgi:hypothetical protein
MYFTKDELDLDSTQHNKQLYITVWSKDVLICKVLINNGSILNVLPKHMLREISVDESHIRPSAYDNSLR